MTFEFVAGRVALDFVATVSQRGTADLERLATPADLALWVEDANLLDRRLSVTEADLRAAKVLREASYAVVNAWTRELAPAERHRRVINAAAAQIPPTPVLTRDGRVRRDGDFASVLAALAGDVIDLAGSADRAYLRWCADSACTRPFIDRSRGHRRRWCGMRGCGDRAKAAAYRRRRRPATAGKPARQV